jgi:benzoate/toluate 1,2-dioxygenase reductase subunit
LQAEHPLSFLPGQYVNLQVPGTKETRSYSFSSAPNKAELASFATCRMG